MSELLWPIMAGSWVGVLFAASFASATVWLCQLAYSGYLRVAWQVQVALMAGLVWAMGLVCSVWLVLSWYARPATLLLGGLATICLFGSALAVRRAPALSQLSFSLEPGARRGLAWRALRRPLFFWGTYVFGVGALNLAQRLPEPWDFVSWLPLFLAGLSLGAGCWFGFFVLLARMGRSIPPDICLRSLNKLRFLSFVILLGLALLNVLDLATLLIA